MTDLQQVARGVARGVAELRLDTSGGRGVPMIETIILAALEKAVEESERRFKGSHAALGICIEERNEARAKLATERAAREKAEAEVREWVQAFSCLEESETAAQCAARWDGETFLEGVSYRCLCVLYKSRAEAAEQRLRVAGEALRRLRDREYDGRSEDLAQQALAQMGENLCEPKVSKECSEAPR